MDARRRQRLPEPPGRRLSVRAPTVRGTGYLPVARVLRRVVGHSGGCVSRDGARRARNEPPRVPAPAPRVVRRRGRPDAVGRARVRPPVRRRGRGRCASATVSTATAPVVRTADHDRARDDRRQSGGGSLAVAAGIARGHESVPVRACVQRAGRRAAAPVRHPGPTRTSARAPAVGDVRHRGVLHDGVQQSQSLHPNLSRAVRMYAVRARTARTRATPSP